MKKLILILILITSISCSQSKEAIEGKEKIQLDVKNKIMEKDSDIVRHHVSGMRARAIWCVGAQCNKCRRAQPNDSYKIRTTHE